MIKPVRIQRRRSAGYDMQAISRAANGLECISVTRPGRFGNPYDVGKFGRPLSMELFRNTASGIWNPTPMKGSPDELCDAAYKAHCTFLKRLGSHPIEIARSRLRGKNLACYCGLDLACHADIWLELANDNMTRMAEEKLILVKAFGSEMEADVAKGALESAGIEAIVLADSAGGMRPHLAWATGGFKLLVREEEESSARAALEPLQ